MHKATSISGQLQVAPTDGRVGVQESPDLIHGKLSRGVEDEMKEGRGKKKTWKGVDVEEELNSGAVLRREL